MKPFIDLHVHSIVSGHAYSTIDENIKFAKSKNLKYLGMSEHGPSMPAAPHQYYFNNIACIPDEIDGVRIIKGVEANILDTEGNIDIDDDLGYYLNYYIASLHPPCIPYGSKEENTSAVINAMKHKKVKIIGHLDDSRYPVDYEKVVKVAKEEGVIFEINNSSLEPTTFREGAWENVGELLKYCEKYNVKVIFGSDAHICYDICNFSNCEEVVKKYNFNRDLIINYNEEEIIKFFDIK